MSHGVELQALSPGCKIRILPIAVKRNMKNMKQNLYDVEYPINSHKVGVLFFSLSEVVRYTLESDISIGPGSSAGNGR